MTLQITSYSINEIGQRSNQEDSLYPSPDLHSSNSQLYILCDGMGGHAAGEVASQTVCSALSHYILTHPTEDGSYEETDFEKALEFAYAALDDNDTNDDRKMGTTLVLVYFHSRGCFVAHIGDSRIYHIRPSERRVLFVTRDHSLINELVELGELTPEEAKNSRQKNIITRAMQPHQDVLVKADCTNLTDLEEGDYIYMCSDGMLENMEDREIVNILSLHKTDSEKIQVLKGATKNNRDNHSAHLIRIMSLKKDKKAIGEEYCGQSNNWRRAVWYVIAITILVIICIAIFTQ